jgi:hypothetical protein
MDDKKKKITAAVSAVMAYIRTEEEAAMQLSMISAAQAEAPPPAPVKLWAISGRQAQMQMRNLMQMKVFK